MKLRNTLVWMALSTTVATACDREEQVAVSDPAESTAVAVEEAPKPTAAAEQAPPSNATLYTVAGPKTPVAVGTPADIELRVEAGEGFKINENYPWAFSLQASEALGVAATEISGDALKMQKASAAIPVKVTANAAGEHTLTATGNFSVCNEDRCELLRDKEVSFTVRATDG